MLNLRSVCTLIDRFPQMCYIQHVQCFIIFLITSVCTSFYTISTHYYIKAICIINVPIHYIYTALSHSCFNSLGGCSNIWSGLEAQACASFTLFVNLPINGIIRKVNLTFQSYVRWLGSRPIPYTQITCWSQFSAIIRQCSCTSHYTCNFQLIRQAILSLFDRSLFNTFLCWYNV